MIASRCPVPLAVDAVEVVYEGEGGLQVKLQSDHPQRLVLGNNAIPLRSKEPALPGRYSAATLRVFAGKLELQELAPFIPDLVVGEVQASSSHQTQGCEVNLAVLRPRPPFVQLLLTNSSSETTWVGASS